MLFLSVPPPPTTHLFNGALICSFSPSLPLPLPHTTGPSYGVAVPSRRPRISLPLRHRVEVPEEIVSLAFHERAQAAQERLRQEAAEVARDKDTIACLDRWEMEHVGPGALVQGGARGDPDGGASLASTNTGRGRRGSGSGTARTALSDVESTD